MQGQILNLTVESEQSNEANPWWWWWWTFFSAGNIQFDIINIKS